MDLCAAVRGEIRIQKSPGDCRGLFLLAVLLLLFGPLIAPCVIKCEYRSFKLITIELYGPNRQVLLNVSYAEGQRRSSHACVCPGAGYDGVGTEYLAGYAIYLRLRNGRQI